MEDKGKRVDSGNDDKKVKHEKRRDGSEPSWYHYLIVVLIFAAVFGIAWGGYYIFVQPQENEVNQSGVVMYKYAYRVGNVTYNLHFENQTSELENMNLLIEPTKYDVLNTGNFRMAFLEYNGSDNGQIAKASTKMTSFLKFVYSFNFAEESFQKIDSLSCENSTRRYKVMVFDPYRDEEGVFYNDTNGCIEFATNDPKRMVNLVDKFIYEMTLAEQNG